MRDEWTITRGPNWGTDANVPPRTGNQGRNMLAAIECGTIGKFKAHKLFYAGGSNGLINMWFNYDKGFILLNNGKVPRRPITGKGRVHDDCLGDTSDLPTREGRWARRRIWQHA
jgi:hypothetical protein